MDVSVKEDHGTITYRDSDGLIYSRLLERGNKSTQLLTSMLPMAIFRRSNHEEHKAQRQES